MKWMENFCFLELSAITYFNTEIKLLVFWHNAGRCSRLGICQGEGKRTVGISVGKISANICLTMVSVR